MTAGSITRAGLRIGIAILASFVDVSVRAESAQIPFAKEIQLEPADCWDKGVGPCAVRTSAGEKFKLPFNGGEIVLDGSTIVARVSAQELRLVAGTIWVKAAEATVVQCEFGAVRAEKGEFWVYRTQERMTVAAIDTTVSMRPRGAASEDALDVLPAMENWVGKVANQTGRAQTGIPTAISIRDHLVRWARLFSGGRAQFEKDAESLYERWTEATAAAADIHKQLYDRRLAAVRADGARRDEERRREQARTKELIDLFKRKVFDP